MKITIKDKEIELKYTLRSMIMYENMTDKTFNPEGLTDVITFMYCVVIASSKDYSLKFDEFIDVLDEHPELVGQFGEWITSSVNNTETFRKN